MNEPPQLPPGELQRQVDDLKVSARLFWTVAVCVPGFLAFFSCFLVPKFEKIFDDMIPGGSAKLPTLTQAVIKFNHLGGLLVDPALILAAMIGALAAVWGTKSIRKGSAIAFGLSCLLLAHWMLFVSSLFLPLISIIQSLGSA